MEKQKLFGEKCVKIIFFSYLCSQWYQFGPFIISIIKITKQPIWRS